MVIVFAFAVKTEYLDGLTGRNYNFRSYDRTINNGIGALTFP